MSVVLSPSMNLPIPVVGVEPGPDYATDINAALTLIDSHTHTAGSGVPITTQALDINADLTMNSNALTGIKALVLSPDTATPAINMIYEDGVDLYFMDGNGNPVRLTQSGAVAGTPGSIANLVPPASATYVGANSTFVWQSNTNIAADMDFGSAIMRNLTPNSTFALTLAPPAGLSSNYQIVLPTLPSSQKIMTLDNSGNMTAPYVVDDSTITIISNTILVKDSGITTIKINDLAVTTDKIDDLAVTNGKIANATILSGKLAWSPTIQRLKTFTASSQTYTVPTGITVVAITGCGGGGGGGSGSAAPAANNTTGGGGGAGGQVGTLFKNVVAGDVITSTQIGTGGTGGAGVSGTSAGNAGNAGVATILTCTGTTSWTVTFYGGMGGPGGTATSYVNANKTFYGGTSSSQGGDCTTGVFGTPTAGYSSAHATGGNAGANGPSGTGGTGGGAAIGRGASGGDGTTGAGGTGNNGLANSGGGGGGGGAVTSGTSGAGGVGGTGVAYIDLVPLA